MMTRLYVFPIALLLAGCDSMERMSAGHDAARVQMAALQSQAVVGAEWAKTQAAASVAQSQAMSEVARTVAWSSQLPWVIGLICLTLIVMAILYWRGRIAVQRYEPAPQAHILPAPERQAILDFAQAHGGQIVWTPDGKPLLQQGDGRRRQLRITAKQ